MRKVLLLAMCLLVLGRTGAACAQIQAGSQIGPKQIKSILFTGRGLISSSRLSGRKYRWIFVPDGWWSREAINDPKHKKRGRWRLSNDGFCMTSYSFHLGNPIAPDSRESCYTVRAVDKNKWMTTEVNSNDTALLTMELSASKQLFPGADSRWIDDW